MNTTLPSDLSSPPTATIGANREIHFGRFDQPIAKPAIAALGRQCRARTKRWQYTSLTLAEHFVAIAVADLGYAAHAFVYVVRHPQDPGSPQRAIEHASLTLTQSLRPALHMAESSIAGTSTWRRRGEHIAITWRTHGRSVAVTAVPGWHLDLDWPLGTQRLRGQIVVDRPVASRCLALVHPVAPNQPAYTHKEAGLPAVVDLRFGDEAIVGPAVATIDWTVGWMSRETRWKWTSAAWLTPDGRRAGLNLSAQVYDDDAGHSRENAVWLDGQLWPLRGVRYDVPANPASEPWRIRSLGGDEVDLTFHPRGARSERLNVGLIVSEFVQPYGSFTGRIRAPNGPDLSLDGVFGVVEDHLSRW